MAGLFQRIAQNYRKKKKITQPSARLNAKEDKTEHAGKVVRAKERIHSKVEKEDFLLSQIDEFREKAKQLQNLLTSKESKVQELQNLVNEREDKAQELEQILSERQEEADEIVSDFSKKVDELAERVTAKMNEIEISVSKQVADVKRVTEEQLEANRKLNENQIAASKKLGEDQIEAGKQFIEEQTAALISELETFLKSSSKPLARAVMAKLVTMVPLFIRDYNQLEEYIQNSLSSCSDVAEKLACIEIIRSL